MAGTAASDSTLRLERLKGIFGRHPEWVRFLKELVQVPVVVDANIVLADIRWLAKGAKRPDARTYLQEAAAAGTVVPYAPVWLRAEIIEKLPGIARRYGISLEALNEVWARYSRCISFYEPTVTLSLASADPKDLAYVALAEELGALVVCTNDSDLNRMGARTIGFAELRMLRDFSRAAGVSASLKVGTTGGVLMSGVILFVAAKAGLRLFARLPPLLQFSLVAAGVVGVLHPKGRAFLSRIATSPGVKSFQEGVWDLLDKMAKARQQTEAHIPAVEALLPKGKRRSLVVHALAVCVASRDAITEAAIEQSVRNAGYVSRSKHLRRYLRRQLKSDGRFREARPGCWAVVGASN